jgi:DNA polymerase-1
MFYIISNNQLIDYKNIKSSSLVDCLAYFFNIKNVQVDTETIGDCLSGYIYTLQLGDSQNQFVIDYQSMTDSEKTQIKEFLEDKSKLFILQNAKYDLQFFYKERIKLVNIYDTFLAECVLTTGLKVRGLGLKDLCKNYLNIEMSKEVRGKINYLGLTEEVVIYAATDVMHLENIMILQLIKIDELELNKVLDLENNVVKVFAEMEFNGFLLNSEKWSKLSNKAENEVNIYLKELNQLIYDNKDIYKGFIEHKVDLFSDEYVVNVNWNSPQQVLAILTLSGLSITSVNEKVIEKFRDSHKLIDIYLKYKEYQTKISKFGNNFLKWINPHTNRVHTSFWQVLNWLLYK